MKFQIERASNRNDESEQTTETGIEGPPNPEGLAEGWSYEYRAAEPNGRPTEWFASPSTFRMCGPHWIRERRLVGPVERVTETEAE